MLDIKFIREHTNLIVEAARKKHIDFDVKELLSVDDKRRELLGVVEEMRAKQNAVTKQIAQASDSDERKRLIGDMQTLKETLSAKEDELAKTMEVWRGLMVRVPNIPDMSVPEGADDSSNQEIRKWGEPAIFSFAPKSHIELMQALGMLDLERGANVSGFRGYFLKGDAVKLSFALWQFTLEKLSGYGFVPMIVPSLVRREPFLGTGYLPQGEEDLYKTQDDEYLSGTSEVPTMGYHMDEVIPKNELPKKFLSFSPCYRREAGSHGKDTKGLMRVHEFFKLEQVVLCEASHEVSVTFHEELTANAESLMQALGLPYRVVVNCGGDLGLGQVKKYDIEAWVPSENTYRETHSSSYFHDFQTRRLNIKYKDDDGKLRFAHSLNNTALATPRLLIPLIENNQREDGTISVPEVLRPYVGKDTIA
ncbi:MAG: serine--tRNA ligase [Candidatus Lloydbacteria bacterium CG22_combo_CG10-13_8_21_14_all_47_15]|uniref:Serine--tRNA ligase n=1 Tax=Candidatus Lloydbacteria bacterium CG22_combo_CG10-13_8_21_14_all_47_15 TaxID=1974635 RepID=A0A2H0CVU3_9BACT|nr:MAG: serine--tRNA ligase [Candidatus Lloydbacteria bacterium CG22_combo_CG10-13_8_21_14_all_47_15]